MPAIYPVPIKNARLGAVMAALDAGSGPGQLVLGSVALNGSVGVLARASLVKPSFVIANGLAQLRGVPLDVIGVAAGTLAKAELRDSNDVVIVTGMRVGLSQADVIASTLDTLVSQSFSVISGFIRHL